MKITAMGSVLSFGEILLRICPDADGNWLKNEALSFHVGGAELNTATALALWGIPVKYVTALPDNDLSAQIINYVCKRGVDTSAIKKTGERLGLFYLTKGKDMKHDAVIYDRAGSSFASLKPGDINWEVVFTGVSWFHLSAICPALSLQTAELCLEALKEASVRDITISIDLNYRTKLWQYGILPQALMPELVKYCDLVMGNVWAAEQLLGIPVAPDIHESGQKSIYLKESLTTSEQIIKQFPKCSAVANTFRFDEGKQGINYYTTLYTGGMLHQSAEYHTEQVTDKVGSGDCFMAGLIYGFYNRKQPADILNFAAAAAFEKLFIQGDATKNTVDQIIKAIKYDE